MLPPNVPSGYPWSGRNSGDHAVSPHSLPWKMVVTSTRVPMWYWRETPLFMTMTTVMTAPLPSFYDALGLRELLKRNNSMNTDVLTRLKRE
ncbi:hypothetical protein DMENIID0001_076780 [Sergentomyia squamirostris]